MIKWDFWKKNKRTEEIEVLPWGQRFDHHTDTTRSSLFAEEDDFNVTHSSPVFSSAARPDTRSRSYEDYLRARGHARQWDGPATLGTGRRYSEHEYEDETGFPIRRAMQILGAIALTAALYFTFQSDNPTAQRMQNFVTSAMTQESNFAAIPTWWKENISDKVAMPTMSNQTGTTSKTGTDTADLKISMPVLGTIKTPYDTTTHQGITFAAVLGAKVKSAAQGTVESVVKEGSEDYTVTVNHGTAGKTIYKHLVTVSIQDNDWVESGQTLGALTKKGDEAELFFAYEKDGQFVDPASALSAGE